MIRTDDTQCKHEYADALGVSGGVMCILVLWALAFAGHSKGTEQAVYALLFVPVPLAAVGIVSFASSRFSLTTPIMAGKIFISTSMLIASALVLAGMPDLRSVSAPRVLSIAVICGLLLASPLFILSRFRTPSTPALRFVDLLLVVALAATLILFSPLEPALPFASTMIGYIRDTPRFGLWIVGGAAYVAFAVLAGIWESRRAGQDAARWTSVALLALATAVALGLYDDGHWTDIGHYAPLLGPALHATAGGVPMVDVYCQYGLAPWVLMRAMFSLSEPSAGSAAILVRLLNVAFLATFVLTAYFVAKRKTKALLLLMPLLVAGISFHAGYLNLNGLPSTQGMRYLPAMALALVLSLETNKAWARHLATVILVSSSFWSIESFLFTLFAWGGYETIQAVRQRSFRICLLRFGIHFGLILAAHLVFVLGVLVVTGRTVDYWPYFDIFLGFVLGRGAWPWPMAMKSEFLWWIPVWFGFFLTIALSLFGAVRRALPGTPDRLLPLALVGIGALSYYVGRSSETTLGLSFLPFAVILVVAFEHASDGQRSPPPGRLPLAMLMATILALAFAFGLERFSRPLDVLKGNSTIVKRCFTPEGCSPARVAERIRAAASMFVDYRYPPVPKLEEMPVRVADLVEVLRKHAPDAKRVALLAEFDGESALTWFSGLMAFLQTRQWYSWQTSSPLNDQLSPELARRIVASATVRDGEPLIIAKEEAKLIGMEREILAKIRGACRLTKVGESEYFSVFRVNACRWNAT